MDWMYWWMPACMNKWNEAIDEMNHWINERRKEGRNEGMNEWINGMQRMNSEWNECN